MTHFFVTWAITALGLLIISQIRLGIEIKNLGTAVVAALVLGILNAILRPILGFFALPITILTLGLFLLVVNAATFGLVAFLLNDFHVAGFVPALLGSLLVSFISWFGSALSKD